MIAKQQPAASLSGSARLLVELNGLNGWLAAIRFATSEADSPLAAHFGHSAAKVSMMVRGAIQPISTRDRVQH